MGKSNIQWCDYTFNGWLGCRFATRADGSPIEECFHCYAKTLDDNRYSKTLDGGTKEHPISHWGSGPRHRTSEQNWKQPLAWNRRIERTMSSKCPKCGTIAQPSPGGECPHASWGVKCGGIMIPTHPRVFCASLGDWLDDENVPIEWFVDLLFLIFSTPHLDWLLLTKRPQNWGKRLHEALRAAKDPGLVFEGWLSHWLDGDPPANVWIGVSAGADQETALAIPARIHFLSCEPMLRPMDTTHAARFDWIIFGGESGSKARMNRLHWVRAGLAFCRQHGIAPFVKQMGGNLSDEDLSECARASGRSMHDSHGGDMDEWPEELRVREFPQLSTLPRP